jgi:predicted Ser/Thr protein kinase
VARTIAQEIDVVEPLETAAGGMTVEVLRHGGLFKADIRKLSHGADDLVLKDFSAKTWFVRLFGRRQIAHEMRALRRLAGLPGIPRCYGEDRRAAGILTEHIVGETITRFCARDPGSTPALFERLAALVSAIHARGVAHLDLRKRDNILVAPGGQPWIIDFNASFCFDPGSAALRLLFPALRRVDEAAILKWKARLAPHLLTPEEARRHRWMSVLRRFWIFN